MTNRFVAGDLGGGAFGMRSSLPGFDVLTEAFGSPNISFDTRIGEIGTVIATGLATVGGAAVVFPTLPYVPLVNLFRWDGTDCYATNMQSWALDHTTTTGRHTWLPIIGIVTSSSLSLVAYTNPFFNTADFYNANGMQCQYAVYATG